MGIIIMTRALRTKGTVLFPLSSRVRSGRVSNSRILSPPFQVQTLYIVVTSKILQGLAHQETRVELDAEEEVEYQGIQKIVSAIPHC